MKKQRQEQKSMENEQTMRKKINETKKLNPLED